MLNSVFNLFMYYDFVFSFSFKVLTLFLTSEWAVKVPVILIMGVATTLDAPRNILPSNVLQHLHLFQFLLGSPSERMDAIVEAVLVRLCSGFCVGHKVAAFMRNYFLKQDGTLTSFIRALKVGDSIPWIYYCCFMLLSLPSDNSHLICPVSIINKAFDKSIH